ncbi:Y-family DNA polymerase [Paractinoplanes rishiriensis]|uniref:DNA polymerase Y family protein n=1 Tax=Paractinoplanes rishiriensis TaxID=1050105 RepID=UPI0019421924
MGGNGGGGEVRTLLLWCPDWPVAAAEIVEGVPATGPVVVLRENRVVACSEAARLEGVRRGLRRREAQSRCPRLVVVDYDAGRDARAFEPVVAAVEEVAVGVEVIRPGACALAARGPARYFGGEEAAAERIVEQVAEACAVESQVGIADGVFAAGLAAREGRVIAPGETRAFLAGMTIDALERPELVDLLKRLGIATLGDFARLPPGDVLTRFGFDGALAHRLAAGQDHRPLAVRRPPLDLDVADTYDEPLERVDVAAFAGRALAERLHDRLAAHGLACTRLGIEAVTADGQELHRVWRHDGTLTAAAIAERVRWQLDGWLTGARRGAPSRPTAGLVRLRLVPDGVLVHLGLQPGLWGDAGAERERAHRALSRVQGLLGPESVVTPVLGGGRSADDQIRLVPWGDEREPARPSAPHPEPIRDLVTTPVLAGTGAEGEGEPAAVISLADRRGEGPDLRDSAEEGLASISRLPVASGAGAAVGADLGGVAGAVAGRATLAEPAASTAGDGAAGDKSVAMVALPRGARLKGGGRRVARSPVLPPWPGRLPKPAPAVVPPQSLGAVVLDDAGTPVGVSARLELTGDPAALVVERGQPVEISGWAGPWPVDERWWAPGEGRRRARFQVALADGRALLLVLAGGHWAVEAIYD